MNVVWGAPGPDDHPALLELVRAVEVADGSQWVTTLDIIRQGIDDCEDPAGDVIAGFHQGRAVALCWISGNRGGRRKLRTIIMPYVHPDHRSDPVADELMRRTEARCLEILDAIDGDLPRLIRSWAPVDVPVLQDLHVRNGYDPQRLFTEMRRPASGGVDSAPLPEGLRLVPFEKDYSEATRLAHNEAFQDHWGSEPWVPDKWATSFIDGPSARLDLSFLVLVGDEVAGYSLAETYPDDFEVLGFSEAWIGALGVRRDWRKRGVATALVAASIAAIEAEGIEYVALGVDSENESGALGLYERLGFRAFCQTITYVKDV